MGIRENYKFLKRWNYLVAQKINKQNKKWKKCTESWSDGNIFTLM